MVNENKISILKKIFNLAIIVLLGAAGVIFSALYVESSGIIFIKTNTNIITPIIVVLISFFTVLTIVFYANKKEFAFKLSFLIIFCYLLIILGLYMFNISGLSDKIDSVEDFRLYIESFGANAVILFIIIQFLQVAVLPIPSFITIGAGVLLFGPLKSAIYSLIGIILGSMTAYYTGRIFGFKVAKWLVGEEDLKKWLKKIRGKDKLILTFMFLFPFFPDDILCFVAGITTMSPLYFFIMNLVTRTISVFVSSFSMNNNIIPYTTWWGILIWIVIFAVTIFLAVLIYKKGDKFQKYFSKKHK